MISKLRTKFVCLAAVSLFVLLAVIVIGMNIINFTSVVSDADDLLGILSKNKGSFPPDMMSPHIGPGGKDHFSPEVPYESRYFSVLLSSEGEVISVDTGKIAAVDKDTAEELAKNVLDGSTGGFVKNFRFLRTHEDTNIRITFLDVGRKMDSFNDFLWASIIMATVGYAVVLLVIIFFSGKFISPIAKSYEKQKRFITDAGHELKTPLTIISANVDILEMEYGSGECLEDIRDQAHRLKALTEDLIYLARMEEADSGHPVFDIGISEVAEYAAASFRAIAKTKELDFRCDIAPSLSIKGEAPRIEQLVNLLLDNAMKYVPTGGTVSLSLEKQGRYVSLSVFNTVSVPVPKESLDSVFDRFYRTDLSRNSETGGQGIGLSIAHAIVTAHGGKIRADAPDDNSFRISATFPHNV